MTDLEDHKHPATLTCTVGQTVQILEYDATGAMVRSSSHTLVTKTETTVLCLQVTQYIFVGTNPIGTNEGSAYTVLPLNGSRHVTVGKTIDPTSDDSSTGQPEGSVVVYNPSTEPTLVQMFDFKASVTLPYRVLYVPADGQVTVPIIPGRAYHLVSTVEDYGTRTLQDDDVFVLEGKAGEKIAPAAASADEEAEAPQIEIKAQVPFLRVEAKVQVPFLRAGAKTPAPKAQKCAGQGAGIKATFPGASVLNLLNNCIDDITLNYTLQPAGVGTVTITGGGGVNVVNMPAGTTSISFVFDGATIVIPIDAASQDFGFDTFIPTCIPNFAPLIVASVHTVTNDCSGTVTVTVTGTGGASATTTLSVGESYSFLSGDSDPIFVSVNGGFAYPFPAGTTTISLQSFGSQCVPVAGFVTGVAISVTNTCNTAQDITFTPDVGSAFGVTLAPGETYVATFDVMALVVFVSLGESGEELTVPLTGVGPLIPLVVGPTNNGGIGSICAFLFGGTIIFTNNCLTDVAVSIVGEGFGPLVVPISAGGAPIAISVPTGIPLDICINQTQVCLNPQVTVLPGSPTLINLSNLSGECGFTLLASGVASGPRGRRSCGVVAPFVIQKSCRTRC